MRPASSSPAPSPACSSRKSMRKQDRANAFSRVIEAHRAGGETMRPTDDSRLQINALRLDVDNLDDRLTRIESGMGSPHGGNAAAWRIQWREHEGTGPTLHTALLALATAVGAIGTPAMCGVLVDCLISLNRGKVREALMAAVRDAP